MPKKGTKKAPKAAAVPRSARMNVNRTARKTTRKTAQPTNIKRVTLPDDATNAQINAFKEKLDEQGYEVLRQLRKSIFYKLRSGSWNSIIAKGKRPITKDPFEFSNMRSALANIKGSPLNSAKLSAPKERSFESAMRSAERRLAEQNANRSRKSSSEHDEILKMLEGLGINESKVKFNNGLPGGIGGARRRRTHKKRA